MTLTETQKRTLHDVLDSKEFKEDLYAGLDEPKRSQLGQFYTPAAVCEKMIEKYDCGDFSGKTILDPCCGSGNLLIAMLCVGADSDKIFGNEYDPIAVELAKKRVNRACDILGKPHVKDWQIHNGNALQARCLSDFSEEYGKSYRAALIDDLDYAQGVDRFGRKLSWEEENRRKTQAKQLSLFDL